MESEEVKQIVKDGYRKIATQGTASCSSCKCGGSKKISRSIGYSEAELEFVGTANLGLGCGNPLAYGSIKEGDTVLDLGSGAGMDVILAARRVGEKGKVIGVDMTEEMVAQAKANAQKRGIKNAEFIVAEIENLPLGSSSVDIIITNCVINLTPDKTKAFKEAYRVLKPGGKMYLSDIVLLAELTKEQREDKDLLSGCVAGALLKEDYLKKIYDAEFKVRILSENREISKQQYDGVALESLMVELTR
jgi:arsenite methyltransferase